MTSDNFRKAAISVLTKVDLSQAAQGHVGGERGTIDHVTFECKQY